MPKPLRVLVFAVLGLTALSTVLFVGGFLLPSKLELKVQHAIEAPAATIFAHLDSHAGIRRWWKPIAKKQGEGGNPGFTIEPLPGPSKGHSMRVAFSSEGKAFETWTCIASQPPGPKTRDAGRIEFDVDFGAFRSRRILSVDRGEGDSDKAASVVTWHETAEVDSVLMRWMLAVGEEPAKELRADALRELDAVVRSSDRLSP